MRLILSVLTLLLVLALPAAAQITEPAPQSPSIVFEIWSIIQPLVMLFVTIVGPALVTWISVRLASFLNVADAAKKKEIEARTATALHQSSLNALKFALTRAGLSLPPATLQRSSPVILDAINYVRDKNPDALQAFGLDDRQLADIILSKAPDVGRLVLGTKPSGL